MVILGPPLANLGFWAKSGSPGLLPTIYYCRCYERAEICLEYFLQPSNLQGEGKDLNEPLRREREKVLETHSSTE